MHSEVDDGTRYMESEKGEVQQEGVTASDLSLPRTQAAELDLMPWQAISFSDPARRRPFRGVGGLSVADKQSSCAQTLLVSQRRQSGRVHAAAQQNHRLDIEQRRF